MTDDYGHWLHGAQLDFVIGHELAHVQKKHAWKGMSAIAGSVAFLMAVALALGPLASSWKVALNFTAAFVPLLAFYALSRRFEYESDRIAVDAMEQGGMAIQALTNLYSRVGFPPTSSFVGELFSTHPSLSRRIGRIGNMEKGQKGVVAAGSF